MPDIYQFIIIVLNNTDIINGMPYGEYRHIKNAIQGTGLTSFDSSADFGSSGVLEGLTVLYRRDSIYNSCDKNKMNGTVLHEIAHRFANWIVPPATGHWTLTPAAGTGATVLRTPTFPDAPTEFNVAVVVIDDDALPADDCFGVSGHNASVDLLVGNGDAYLSEPFGAYNSFYNQTGSRGTLRAPMSAAQNTLSFNVDIVNSFVAPPSLPVVDEGSPGITFDMQR